MTTIPEEPACEACGETEAGRLERCGICAKFFCFDCAFRAWGGRRFCSEACSRTYYFHGDEDDDENPGPDHDE